MDPVIAAAPAVTTTQKLLVRAAAILAARCAVLGAPCRLLVLKQRGLL
jgi:hypothetical protein